MSDFQPAFTIELAYKKSKQQVLAEPWRVGD
jgi:hypothetical protein